ncbi:MAG: hypothetical protein ABIQ86_06865 [Steroidobacteraceae bacterium]
MRYLFAIVLVLLAQQSASAEILVGTAVLKFQRQSKYQPGSCTEQTLAKAEGDALEEVCIDFRSWSIYEVIGFRDLKGRQHAIKSIVAVSHLDLSGEWLLVVEELPKGDASKFGVPYRVVNRSNVVHPLCLDAPLEKHTGDPVAPPGLMRMEGWYCYDLQRLSLH